MYSYLCVIMSHINMIYRDQRSLCYNPYTNYCLLFDKTAMADASTVTLSPGEYCISLFQTWLHNYYIQRDKQLV